MSEQLTDTYVVTLRWVHRLTLDQGYPPSIPQIAKLRGMSNTAILKHLQALERAGLAIRREPGQARSLVVTQEGRRCLKNRRAK